MNFGLKAKIGAEKYLGLVQTLVMTVANVSDISQWPVMLRGQEVDIWLDAGYVVVD